MSHGVLPAGVKIVIFTICTAMRHYNKYRDRCVEAFPPSVIITCDALSAACDALALLNMPGPR